MLAVKTNIQSELLKTNLPDCSLACKLVINNQTIFLCAFYNPAKGSKYRYTKEEFCHLVNAMPKNSTSLICGDLNFPETNWNSFTSQDDEEQGILEVLEKALYR